MSDTGDDSRGEGSGESRSPTDSAKGRTAPNCARCRNHGLKLGLKAHKRYCRYRKCECELCIGTAHRQDRMAKQTAQRRAQVQDMQRPPHEHEVAPEPLPPLPPRRQKTPPRLIDCDSTTESLAPQPGTSRAALTLRRRPSEPVAPTPSEPQRIDDSLSPRDNYTNDIVAPIPVNRRAALWYNSEEGRRALARPAGFDHDRYLMIVRHAMAIRHAEVQRLCHNL